MSGVFGGPVAQPAGRDNTANNKADRLKQLRAAEAKVPTDVMVGDMPGMVRTATPSPKP